MIQITNKIDCCGCNACGDACAHGAITFETDIEGFWYPKVDMTKCTDCHLCEKVCPIINHRQPHDDFDKPLCYAAMHKNYEVRFDSTSGGLFSAFAEKIYHDGGYVGGAVYDDSWNIHHFISNDKTDLQRLRSSKYAQSSAIGLFKKTKELLKAGEKVLVCGTPCQIAALNSFLKTNYDNLYTIDFICRGVNSPMIDKKADADDEKEYGAKIIYKKAKNKELGWHNLTYKTIFANGQVRYLTKHNNIGTRGYLITNVFSRPSCYDCKFKGKDRHSDITLADFWGIEKVDKTMNDDLGTSVVMIHSQKGKELFDAIQQKVKIVEVSFENITKGNPMLMESQPAPFVNRDDFYADLDKGSYQEVANKYFPIPQQNLTLKDRLRSLKNELRSFYGRNLYSFLRFAYYNFFHKSIISKKTTNSYLFLSRYAIVDISPTAKLKLNAPFHFGFPRIKGSKLESRLLVEDNATFEINSLFGCGYGADIEVFKGASLIIKNDLFNQKSGGANIGLTIICGNRIEIGEECMMGRHVTIRDNNGGHYLSVQGYKVSKPVIIGKHVWICEGATIMQGVKIGDGAIIGAHSVVYSNVPPFSLVSGNPAKVVQTNVYWKF